MNDDKTRIAVPLPDLGVPSVEVGIWHVQLGDHVYRGDRLVEVVLGGATFDVTSPVDGEFVERCVAWRERITAGTVLGRVQAGWEN